MIKEMKKSYPTMKAEPLTHEKYANADASMQYMVGEAEGNKDMVIVMAGMSLKKNVGISVVSTKSGITKKGVTTTMDAFLDTIKDI